MDDFVNGIKWFQQTVSPRLFRRSGTSKTLQETDLEILSESLCSVLAVTTDPGTNQSHPIDFDKEICAAKRQKRPRTRNWKAEEKGEKKGYSFRRLEEPDKGAEEKDYFGGSFDLHFLRGTNKLGNSSPFFANKLRR